MTPVHPPIIHHKTFPLPISPSLHPSSAAAVFAGYYQSSAPGIYLTPPVVNSLLSVLLKAGLVPDIVHVLNVCAARKILVRPRTVGHLLKHFVHD